MRIELHRTDINGEDTGRLVIIETATIASMHRVEDSGRAWTNIVFTGGWVEYVRESPKEIAAIENATGWLAALTGLLHRRRS